jgi:membrane peptidoglycan carboxypeptidase
VTREIRQRIGLLAVVSVAAGLVAAGIAMPVVGGLGLVGRAGVDAFEKLPSYLNIPPLPVGSRILAANGRPLATFYYQNRIPVSIKQIPAVMQKAIIAIEDDRFYAETALDFKGLLRAAFKNTQAGGVVQGGSTLTQQYVKNILIDEAQGNPAEVRAVTADTVSRKIREARYAIALAQRLSKNQILEGYLNIAYFGDGAYGIGSAAEHYFGEPVGRHTLPQAALLAGIVQDPSLYDPAQHPVHAEHRRNTVLNRMAQLSMITPADAAAAAATPIRLHLTNTRNGCVNTFAPYFCQYVVDDLLANPAFGRTPQDRARLLTQGGLTITTTLDPTDQTAAQNAVDAKVPWNGTVGAAEAMIEPGTGDIRAMVVNAPYGPDHKKGQNSVNWAADEDHGGSTGFQTGSAFKVFVLAAALQEHIPVLTTIYAPPVIGSLAGYTGCPALSSVYQGPIHNAEPGNGNYNLLTGTWNSINTFYVQLEQRTGMCEPATLAAAMGLQRADGKPLNQYPSMVLGSNEVSPLDMADAYATLAAQGKHCPPVAITRVVDHSGHVLPLTTPACDQALDPGLANTETSILEGVIQHGTGTPANIGRPAAGKTGTMDNFSAAWFCGYTPQLAAAVWVGFPAGIAGQSLENITLGGQTYSRVFGATIPAPIWQLSMSAALANEPVVDFPAAASQYLVGQTVPVPDVTGAPPAAAVATLTAAGFQATVVPGRVNGTTRPGTVARTDPPAGTQAPQGSNVLVYISNGHPPPPSPSPSSPGPSAPPSASPPAQTPTPSPPRHGHHG